MNSIKRFILFLVMAASLMLASDGKVPITGRRQIKLVDDKEVLELSLQSYKSFMKTARLSTNKTQTAQVTRVGKKIARATEAFLRAEGLAADIKNFSWEFKLVKNDEMNAWCMPGGKIVVYEGIMKLIDSDDELAVVLGHEVAHTIARHANERLSQQKLAEYGSIAVQILTLGKSSTTRALSQAVYGLGANYGVMQPFSRKHESEADYMGLILMAKAGYNPDVAVNFWRKMSKASGTKLPELLSSHPSDATRIADIQETLPAIKRKYCR